MSKIYTKTGDKGYTSLVGGKRVKKNSAPVEAYGTVDEANSLLGVAIAELKKYSSLENIMKDLIQIQQELFRVGAELSTPIGDKVYWPMREEYVTRLEGKIDFLNKELPPLDRFIIPGGSVSGAMLHLARTVIRRAERSSTEIIDLNPIVLSYLNRLSDYLFVSARFVNYQLNEEEHTFTLQEE